MKILTASSNPEKRGPSQSTIPSQRRVWEHDGGPFPGLARGEGAASEGSGMLRLWWGWSLCLELPGKTPSPLVERGSGILQSLVHLSAGYPGVARGGPEDVCPPGLRSRGKFPRRHHHCPLGSSSSGGFRPLVANSLNGQHLGRITKATRPLRTNISGNHQEEISLLIIDTPHSPVVLGHPWMAKNRPQVDWVKHEILEWDASCSRHCLQKEHAPVAAPQLEEAPNLVRVPEEYHDLKEVFCKACATCLPPHRPYDCVSPREGSHGEVPVGVPGGGNHLTLIVPRRSGVLLRG